LERESASSLGSVGSMPRLLQVWSWTTEEVVGPFPIVPVGLADRQRSGVPSSPTAKCACLGCIAAGSCTIRSLQLACSIGTPFPMGGHEFEGTWNRCSSGSFRGSGLVLECRAP